MDKEKKISEQLEIEKLSEIVNKNKKTSRSIALISVVAVVIGLTITIKNNFKLTNQQLETKDSIMINQIIIDSLISRKDSISIQYSKKDTVAKFITEFLTTIKTDGNLNNYYANKVQNYYLKKNISLEQIKKEKKSYNQLHPKSKLLFNPADITVNIKDDKTSEVFVNTLYYPDSLGKPIETIYQIKLNNENKIFFVRNLEPDNKQKPE